MSVEEIVTVNDALNEYFRLKEKFENEMNVHKKKLINKTTLSNKEKRAEFLKLMPKCVNCKRPSKKGTFFSVTHHSSDDRHDSYRSFKASCGDIINPCNLHIEINIGSQQSLDESMYGIRNEIAESKNTIINDKNKLLFGLITTETALENFDNNKSYISDLTSIYENYLDTWTQKINNPQKLRELEESLIQSYENINAIKDCIKKMNQTGNTQFAVDAVTIYHTTLEPLLNKIRLLKYRENSVFSDDNNTCKLIQKRYTIEDTLGFGYVSKVIAYDVGLKATINKKTAVIMNDSDDDSSLKMGGRPIQINIDNIENGNMDKSMDKDIEIDDDPIIGQGKDGISWNNAKYQELWNKLPDKLKTEFKLNIDWMKAFMYTCVNKQDPYYECRIPIPPNIVIPPRKMTNGQYDFGVSIYNKAFSKLPEATQTTYLTFYMEDSETKAKNYSKLEDALNELVEKELDFDRGFF
jgi:hypothetical protein